MPINKKVFKRGMKTAYCGCKDSTFSTLAGDLVAQQAFLAPNLPVHFFHLIARWPLTISMVTTSVIVLSGLLQPYNGWRLALVDQFEVIGEQKR